MILSLKELKLLKKMRLGVMLNSMIISKTKTCLTNSLLTELRMATTKDMLLKILTGSKLQFPNPIKLRTTTWASLPFLGIELYPHL